ncbi:BlaI/MecI/CopY family transcriptional regulator [Brevibacillus sp. M2.1A]|uniref:BlaI/MecI/CopY family transcriptional regulator n=1 Tax=Brevibacillus TaxID=55080 RepID=UPI00156B9ABA|nr:MULTISPECIES: BlaI/MecI/CopY family transcriptional regulator [Brevibacillus]MBY0086628.1 BlaI/MecI/CopY family transcriptional regulator [Brevibacillus brevis]MCC8437550.1 BlaI/MecI/CopY family transcriptional regulator [Brevibacillus sp. M2.1A]MCE0450990.1 BlaI/MecI/CopY family transcriptional regulator [Brevibacillus sp. AF8]UKK99677.1 BlaI/MecI/CopY family transcriptional regulator [Brevibacillus brevis]
MHNLPKISEAEWEIMKIIWKNNPINAENIALLLPDEIEWTDQTVRTFINRLLKKKVIGFEKAGRSYKYFPLISEKECIKAESQSFLKRVFSGAADMMMTNFLEDVKLSQKDIEHLQKILNEKQKDKDKRGDDRCEE